MIDVETMTIMIVDDMEPMRKSVRGMLKVINYGKNFRYASNGVEALKVLKETSIDFAIIDWNMPIMGGVELLGRIREDRDLRYLPVVMITAEAERGIVAEVAETEIDAYLLKPLTVKALEEKIRIVVEMANNPSPMIRHLRKSRIFEEAGNMDAAIGEAKLALNEDPSSSKPIRELGILYYKKNDIDTAEKCFLKAAKMNKLDVFAFHYLGEIYLKRDNIDKASEFFNKAMKISPRHVTRGIYFGKVLVEKGMLKKAINVFEKVFEISKDSLTLREEIANYCLEKGVFNFAISLLEFILKNVPGRDDLLFKLGIANESINNPKGALQYFLGAEKKDKNNINLKMHIAKNYIKINQSIRADNIIRAILKKEPENEEAKELLRQCV